jgi:hypothetical protein
MDTINESLEKVTDSWNNYFWRNKFCQNHINFTSEIKTNYYGDILSYFNNTLVLLTDIKPEKEFNKSILQAIGILQLIYTHQDLIDELLYIFKLPRSTKDDKNPNRDIRNELIGHPIRRKLKGNELISSVFFGREFKNGTIHYILYTKENNFSGKEVLCTLKSIIDSHQQFLKKHVRIILNKIEKVLRQLQKKLTELEILIHKNVDFYKLLKLVDQYFNSIYKENYLLEREILTTCFEKQQEHPRYKVGINIFLDTLKDYIPETIKNIDELFSEEEMHFDKTSPEVIITYSNEGETNFVPSSSNHLHYELSKLFDKHPVYGIDYFKRKFHDDEQIIGELINMENNVNDILEYYSSYEYLCILLKKKGYEN